MSASMLAYEDASTHSTASALDVGLAPAPSPAAADAAFEWTAGKVRAWRCSGHNASQLQPPL